MKMKFGFCTHGLICFILLMIPNIFWFAFPAANVVNEASGVSTIGIIQSVARISFFTFTILFISEKKMKYKSLLIIFMALMLLFYYIAWIRYFTGDCDSALLVAKLWFIPIPLAIFPVLFFIGESLWLKNVPALISAVVFGVFHCYEAYIGYIKL